MTKQLIRARLKKYLAHSPYEKNVRRVSLFGSTLHGTAKKKSDIDLLIEFKKPVGFFELARLQKGLHRSLGKRVDLVTPKALSKYFRKEVLGSAEKIYEK